MTVCLVSVSLGYCLDCLVAYSPVCLVPQWFKQRLWCTKPSLCSSSPRRRGSILVAKCRMMMDSRLRGNDGWICGNDCLLSACIVWVMSGGLGWCESCLRSAPIACASALVQENSPRARHPGGGGDP